MDLLLLLLLWVVRLFAAYDAIRLNGLANANASIQFIYYADDRKYYWGWHNF